MCGNDNELFKACIWSIRVVRPLVTLVVIVVVVVSSAVLPDTTVQFGGQDGLTHVQENEGDADGRQRGRPRLKPPRQLLHASVAILRARYWVAALHWHGLIGLGVVLRAVRAATTDLSWGG